MCGGVQGHLGMGRVRGTTETETHHASFHSELVDALRPAPLPPAALLLPSLGSTSSGLCGCFCAPPQQPRQNDMLRLVCTHYYYTRRHAEDPRHLVSRVPLLVSHASCPFVHALKSRIPWPLGGSEEVPIAMLVRASLVCLGRHAQQAGMEGSKNVARILWPVFLSLSFKN